MKYYANICKSEGNGSLIGHAIKEMKTAHNPTLTSWFSRVAKNRTFFGLQYSTFSNIYGKLIKKQIQSGAELCQAQDKLVLAKPALPITKLRLSSNCKDIKVFFHIKRN